MARSSALEATTLRTFLSSSWFAEAEADSVVSRLLLQSDDPEERRLLESYAAEEQHHAELIDGHLNDRGLEKGPPFWIQPLFRVASSRLHLLLQIFHVELLAGVFYGAMAEATQDLEARALIRRLLRDEARHIRLFRELLARELAVQPWTGRVQAQLIVFGARLGLSVTAWVQSLQLRPVLGATGVHFPVKVFKLLLAQREALFRGAHQPDRPLGWWWAQPIGS